MDFQPHPVFPSLWLIGPRVGPDGPETALTVICKGTFAAGDPNAAPLSEQQPIRLADEPLNRVANGDFALLEEGVVVGWSGDVAFTVISLDAPNGPVRFPHLLEVRGSGSVRQRLRFDAPLAGRRFALSYMVRDPNPLPRVARAQVIAASGTPLPGVGGGTVPAPVGNDPVRVTEQGTWPGHVADSEADLILHGRNADEPVQYDVVALIEGASIKPHDTLLHEHDLAPTKPAADLVVLGAPAPPAATPGVLSWTERIALESRARAQIFTDVDRSEPFTFGWVSRSVGPRPALAGTDLDAFDPDAALLPQGFDDRFHNGGQPPTSGGPAFEPPSPGSAILVATTAGAEEDVIRLHLPAAFPRATLTRLDACDCPLDEDLALRADTVVYDKASRRFTVVWRGVRPFDPARLARLVRLRLRGGG